MSGIEVPRKSDHPTAYYLSGRAKGLPKVPRRPEPSLLDHRHGSGHPWPLSRAVGCWVTAVAPTVKTIPPKPCPGISEIGVFRNCPDPEMLVSPEPSSKSQVSRVKHFPWDVGGTPFLGTLGVRPSLGRWGYALPAFVPKVGSDKPCSNHYCGNHQPCQGQADCPDVPLLSSCKSAFGYALGEFGCAI
jgi:hypothetical protein